MTSTMKLQILSLHTLSKFMSVVPSFVEGLGSHNLTLKAEEHNPCLMLATT